MDLDDIMKILKELSPIGTIALIYVLFSSGLIWYFVPIILWVIFSIVAYGIVQNKYISPLLGIAFTTFIMSIMGLLIHYFPNSIGTGLFADGYTFASVVTIGNLFDIFLNTYSKEIGIGFDWTVVVIGGVITALFFIGNRNHTSFTNTLFSIISCN